MLPFNRYGNIYWKTYQSLLGGVHLAESDAKPSRSHLALSAAGDLLVSFRRPRGTPPLIWKLTKTVQRAASAIAFAGAGIATVMQATIWSRYRESVFI